MTRLQRWADRRMFRDLARMYEEDATRCRRNAAPERPANGIVPGSAFWNDEVLRKLDKAVEYRDKERALR